MARNIVTHIGSRRRPKLVEPGILDDGPGPWTSVRLALARRCTEDADSILKSCGYTLHEIEVARWTLLGRTNDEALSILSGQGRGEANNLSALAK